MNRTTLYDEHIKCGAKMVPFAGFEMPIKYSGEIVEHKNVREHAGLFDVSHMGEIFIVGKDARAFCQKTTCNDVNKLSPGKIHYTVLCNEKGGAVDDCTLYMFDENQYMFCVNAANSEKDFSFMKTHKKGNVEIVNKSNDYDLLALQGPKAESILQKIIDVHLKNLNYFWFTKGKIFKHEIIISRTGYTGEDGFEIYIHPSETKKLWALLLEKGKSENILPIGLGARDTLRLEAGYILYGHELDDETSPIEAGIAWAVKLDKGNFLGKEIIAAHAHGHMRKKLVGIKMLERGIPRSHYPVYFSNEKIGYVTSGGYSPTLDVGIAFAFVQPSYAEVGQKIDVEIRNNKLKAEICRLPFYKRS